MLLICTAGGGKWFSLVAIVNNNEPVKVQFGKTNDDEIRNEKFIF